MEIELAIRKYALQNAVRYKGKANPGNVIPKILGEFPAMRKDVKSIIPKVNLIVKEVNLLSPEDQLKELNKIAPELLEVKQKEKGMKELDGTDKGVVMRFAPSPSGPMHIGHAVTGGLTSLYVKRYHGKYILRIEDTNSDNIYPPAYEMLPEDSRWIFGNIDEVWIQSDRMQIYYDYAMKFFSKGATYVCTCTPDKFREYSKNKKECPCRSLPSEEQLKRWDKMLDRSGYKPGEAVVRFKSDMKHPNPAMRDFPLLRINDSKHPRQGLKYRVWPLMNFSVWVDDVEGKMTHIIRGKDHADNAKRQELMYAAFGLKAPRTYFNGRFQFTGMELSSSKTREKIEAGVYEGWEDIRLPFLGALKRRGYQPEALLRWIESIGLSPVDKKLSKEELFKAINAYNKEIIDPIAKRFFFVHDPVEIEIKDAPLMSLELNLHPDNIKGGRKFKTSRHFFICKEDYEKIGSGLVRLMDCLNFRKSGKGFEFVSKELSDYKADGKMIIHWLPKSDDLVKCGVLMPDNTRIEGLCESGINNLKPGDIVQFERFGFCRLDAKSKFWFAHK